MRGSIEDALKVSFEKTNALSEAILYALLSEGKRLRPRIVYAIANDLGHNLSVEESALAVEFFHTASLIADDLPCMDNDDTRRGKESLHKAFGERTALLASYALISEAFKKIEENGQRMKESGGVFAEKAFEATVIALREASLFSGIRGAVLGQYFDLFVKKQELTEPFLEEIIYLKTTTLFEGALVLGFLFGGGEFSLLGEVKALARHVGLAFQIQDDLKDLSKDAKNKSLNFALFCGEETAKRRFHLEMEGAFCELQKLSLSGVMLRSLLEGLSL